MAEISGFGLCLFRVSLRGGLWFVVEEKVLAEVDMSHLPITRNDFNYTLYLIEFVGNCKIGRMLTA
ncbi:MAG: hypothetical protein GX664_02805 [Bacteroidales bacterium]|nr:hypothetical protein [Bacteroidales bacterium]